MSAIPSIKTKRPTLLAHLECDLHAMNDYLSKDRMSFITGPFDDVGTWRTLLASLGHWHLCGFGFWHIEHRESGTMAAAVGFLHHFDWPETDLSLNMHHDFEGESVAYEAALAKRLGAIFEESDCLREHDCHVFRHPAGDTPKKVTQSETNK